MGYGMGKLEIIEHDGQGGLTFEERPFVVMVDRAFVDLGVVKRPKLWNPLRRTRAHTLLSIDTGARSTVMKHSRLDSWRV